MNTQATKVNLEAYVQRLIEADYYTRIAATLSTTVAVGSIVASVLSYDSPNIRRAANVMAIGSGFAGLIAVKLNRQIIFESNDLQDVETSLAQSSNFLARRAALLPGKGIVGIDSFDEMNNAEEPTVEWFDLKANISNNNLIPHVAILAETGAGKSTLATGLAKQLKGKTIVVDPHYSPGSYPGADLIIGRRRNVGEYVGEPYEKQIKGGKEPEFDLIGEPEVSFSEFEKAITRSTAKADYIDPAAELSNTVSQGKPAFHSASISQFVWSLAGEMSRRYELRDKGVTDFEPINVILDEFLVYSKVEGFDTVFKMLLREARKVNIRLIILIQGAEVKALGVEGEGSVRDSLKFIRLGKFARDHIKLLAKKDKSYSAIASESVRIERFATFEDQPLDVQSITNS